MLLGVAKPSNEKVSLLTEGKALRGIAAIWLEVPEASLALQELNGILQRGELLGAGSLDAVGVHDLVCRLLLEKKKIQGMTSDCREPLATKEIPCTGSPHAIKDDNLLAIRVRAGDF